ncbi:uncharacterized protein [Palaemon carinicauda]|uniref:uncharacterized protein n=1 Tax=Palaemon carinicauda TaxID=392227 RepID=UPI0035B5AA62
MEVKSVAVLIGICVIAACICNKATASNPKTGKFYQKSVFDDQDQTDTSVTEKPFEGFHVIIAERLLGALGEIFDGLLKGKNANDPIVMFGNGIRFGLYMVLGYNDKHECYQRCWCMAGTVLGRLSNTTTAALLAVRYVAPQSWHSAINLAEEGALGIPCTNYKCGTGTEQSGSDE